MWKLGRHKVDIYYEVCKMNPSNTQLKTTLGVNNAQSMIMAALIPMPRMPWRWDRGKSEPGKESTHQFTITDTRGGRK